MTEFVNNRRQEFKCPNPQRLCNSKLIFDYNGEYFICGACGHTFPKNRTGDRDMKLEKFSEVKKDYNGD